MDEDRAQLLRFERGEFDAHQFAHREHLRMAFAMLRAYDFAEAAFRYSRALRVMLERVARPQGFHQTITIAFLSLIAERLAARDYADFESFVSDNGDLLDKSALGRWYRPKRLGSDAARSTFLLPDMLP